MSLIIARGILSWYRSGVFFFRLNIIMNAFLGLTWSQVLPLTRFLSAQVAMLIKKNLEIVCACLYVWVWLCVCVRMAACICAYGCAYACLYVCVTECMCACILDSAGVSESSLLYIYIYIYIYIYTVSW